VKYSQEWCIENINNEYWQVRFDVAQYIDISYLPQMMNDEEYVIRSIIAQRIDPSYLIQMMYDESQIVRYDVARRIDKKNALLMSALDDNKYVRETAWNNVLGTPGN
jgi:hypothetical protein